VVRRPWFHLTRILPIRVPLGSDHGYEVHIFLQYSNRFHTSFAGYRLLDVLFEGRVLTSDVYQDILNCFSLSSTVELRMYRDNGSYPPSHRIASDTVDMTTR